MKKTILFCAIAFLLTACGGYDDYSSVKEANTTSGDIGPFVETSNILLISSTSYSDQYAGTLFVSLGQNDPPDALRVGTDDSLLVTFNDSPQVVKELRRISCEGRIGPCTYDYSYQVDFQEYPEGQTMTISIERESGVSSHTTVDFPPKPTIIDPDSGTILSLSTDTMNISWQPGDIGDSTKLDMFGQCVVYEELWFTDPDSALSFDPGTFQFSTDNEFCTSATEIPLLISTSRFRYYPADPALAPDSFLRLFVGDEVTVQMLR